VRASAPGSIPPPKSGVAETLERKVSSTSSWAAGGVRPARGGRAAATVLAAVLAAGLVAALVGALTGCATTTYKPFETRGDAIFDGKGGTRSVEDGMDIWEWGDPPRRYRVLGLIDDERPGGAVQMARLRSDMVKKAREVGGQALIQVRNQSRVVGSQTTGNTSAAAYAGPATAMGATTTKPLRENSAQFIVIRYLD